MSWLTYKQKVIHLRAHALLKVQIIWSCNIKMIGGSRVILSWQAQMKVFIASVSTLFTAYRKSAEFRRYDCLNFWTSILSYSRFWAKSAPKITYLGLSSQKYLYLRPINSQKVKNQLDLQYLFHFSSRKATVSNSFDPLWQKRSDFLKFHLNCIRGHTFAQIG